MRVARLLALAAVMAVAVWSACTDSPGGPQKPDGRLALVANVSGTSVQTLVVEVTADDIAEPLLFNIEVEDGIASGTLVIPAGSDRLITVSAFNGDGIETHEGSAETDVHPGPNLPLAIVLTPLTGELPIDVSIGHLSIVIEPAAVTLEVGETEQLEVTVLDVHGEPMAADVLWATSHPGVATVDQTGLVTGTGAGDGKIVVTFEGVAGVATVAVSDEEEPTGLRPGPGELVISEVMMNPDAVADAAGEWFEVYNPTATDFELHGVVVRDDDLDQFTIDQSVTAPAGGYIVLGLNGDDASNGGVTLDYAYPSEFVLGNTGDEIELLFDEVVIDRMTYGFEQVVAGRALSLDPGALDASDNDVAENWCPAPGGVLPGGDYGTPGAANPACPPPPGDWYQPDVTTTWQWQLSGTVNTSYGVDAYIVDLFDVPAATITTLHNAGRAVLCQFSAGSWEDWRPDAGNFLPEDLGNEVDGWPGEVWLNIMSASVLANMEARLDLAVSKGCEGVVLGKLDGYAHTTGFPLAYGDQVAYNATLAGMAHAKGLAAGMVSGDAMVADLVDEFDYAVSEDCHLYDECGAYAPYTAADKPIFNGEFDDTYAEDATERANMCVQSLAAEIRTLVLPLALNDAYRYSCDDELPVPSELDWRDFGYVTSVKNQGSCGSSWVFPVVAAVESRVMIDAGDNTLQPDLSELEIMQCTPNDACNGGPPTTALAYIRDTGVHPESCSPYTPSDNDACPSCGGTPVQITGYHTVTLDIASINEAIYEHGPVVMIFDAYQDLQSYAAGVYVRASTSLLGGHAVVLVGYSDAGQYWIAKNSWGTSWGESGYFRYGYANLAADVNAIYAVDGIQ